jgi:hypothetical protein
MTKQTIRCAILLLTLTAPLSHGRVILNEYNSVRASRWLDEDGATASSKADTHFGRVRGNGGRWFELLVVGETSTPGETVDMRGWSFDWSDTDLGSGSITLSNDSRLQNIHRGTLLTVFAQDDGTTSDGDVNPENVATNYDDYNPAAGDWWLNLNLADSDFIASGSLDTGNDDWQLTIKDNSNNTVFGPVGEGVGVLSGVNSREIAKLENYATTIGDWQSVTPGSEYNDGTTSTFGSENVWSGGDFSQDFSSLRAIPEPGVLALFGISALILHTLRRYRRG